MKRLALLLAGVVIACATGDKGEFDVFYSSRPAVYQSMCLVFVTTDGQILQDCEGPCEVKSVDDKSNSIGESYQVKPSGPTAK